MPLTKADLKHNEEVDKQRQRAPTDWVQEIVDTPEDELRRECIAALREDNPEMTDEQLETNWRAVLDVL